MPRCLLGTNGRDKCRCRGREGPPVPQCRDAEAMHCRWGKCGPAGGRSRSACRTGREPRSEIRSTELTVSCASPCLCAYHREPLRIRSRHLQAPKHGRSFSRQDCGQTVLHRWLALSSLAQLRGVSMAGSRVSEALLRSCAQRSKRGHQPASAAPRLLSLTPSAMHPPTS
jgi:hypothetical protein